MELTFKIIKKNIKYINYILSNEMKKEAKMKMIK